MHPHAPDVAAPNTMAVSSDTPQLPRIIASGPCCAPTCAAAGAASSGASTHAAMITAIQCAWSQSGQCSKHTVGSPCMDDSQR